MKTFQEIIRDLSRFWETQGCIVHQGYDLEVGAGTLNPATFLRCLGPEPYKAAYVEPSRRPTDGRFGENPNRLHHYFQYQVILKPSPPDIQKVYLESLEAIGLDLSKHDIRFVHDDWENPTIGAAGLGWETWIDGMEVTQITYFQAVGSLPVKPVTGEITYGLERLAMYLQNKDSIFDIQWNDELTYGDVYHRNEVEWSGYNFNEATVDMWHRHFNDFEKEAAKLLAQKLPIPAFDFVCKASHAFNVMDARGSISVTERTGYITRIRNLARQVATSYIESREALGFPLQGKWKKKEQTLTSAKPDFSPLKKKTSADFLLEIGSEELPASFVEGGLQNLKKSVEALLKEEEIAYRDIQVLGTPRRLSLLIHDLATVKPVKTIEKKGPPIQRAYDEAGSLTPAGKGFFESIGLSPVAKEKAPVQTIKGVDYLVATIQTAETHTAELLMEKLPSLIENLPFPKKMRWADLDITYARPILWMVALFDKTPIPFRVGNITAGTYSFGHRQLDPSSFAISHPKEYVDLLRKHHVLVDIEERRASILKQLSALEQNVEAVFKEKVLEQVLHLVEYPFLTVATFDEAFLKAPKELLVSEMIEHQKYFPLMKKEGALVNSFIITANNTPSDAIRHGNKRVLSARLSDGTFLYAQDLKWTLDQFNEKLKSVAYQQGLGTVYDKVQRLIEHARTLAPYFPSVSLKDAERAALYCKADLVSAVVYEFPELQGLMGKYYALAAKESPTVASAIEEHWMPKGEKAPLPSSDTATLLSIAEKLDNLLGCFTMGLKPSSSSDPYALRRQVMGLIRMLLHTKTHLPLKATLTTCLAHFPPTVIRPEAVDEILEFIANRIKTIFQDEGMDKDLIEASLSKGVDDIYDMYCRVQALQRFKNTSHFPKLLEVYKRAKGQLQNQHQSLFSPALLSEPAEHSLADTLEKIRAPFQNALTQKDYDAAYHTISTLQAPLARLFDEVKILAEDPSTRHNRLALLNQVFTQFEALLDFSKVSS